MKKKYLVSCFVLIGLVLFSACGNNNSSNNDFYQVSIVSQNLEYGSVVGNSSQIKSGSTIVIAALANSGFYFDEWSDGIRDNPRTLNVEGNINLIAKFNRGSLIEYDGHRLIVEGGTIGEYDEDTYIIRANNPYSFAYWRLANIDEPLIWTSEFFMSKGMLSKDFHYIPAETLHGYGAYIIKNTNIIELFNNNPNKLFTKAEIDDGAGELFEKHSELTKNTNLESSGYNDSLKTYFYDSTLLFSDPTDYFIILQFYTLQNSEVVLVHPIRLKFAVHKETINGLKFKDGNIYRELTVEFYYAC